MACLPMTFTLEEEEKEKTSAADYAPGSFASSAARTVAAKLVNRHGLST